MKKKTIKKSTYPDLSKASNIRVPRIQGSTALALTYNQTKTEEDKERIYKHIINNYINTGFLHNGIPLNSTQLSIHLGIPHDKIQNLIKESLSAISTIVNKDNIENTFRAVLALATQWSLESKGNIMQQVNILKNSQGDHYKPFLSSTLNQALKLSLDSDKNIIDLIKTVSQSSKASNPFIPLNPNPNEQENKKENNYLSIEQVLDILEQNNKKEDTISIAKYNKEYQQQLWDQNNLGVSEGILWDSSDLPNCSQTDTIVSIEATEQKSQKGLPLGKEVPEIPKIRHLKRRQKDLQILDDDSI